jgi:initiation factor 1A
MGKNKMKKNPKGGKGHKKKASKSYNNNFSKNLIEKDSEAGQEYAQVVKLFGGSRVLVRNESGEEVQAVIPGRFRRRNYIRLDDYIIIQQRTFNINQYDVVYCSYSKDDIEELKKLGHIKKDEFEGGEDIFDRETQLSEEETELTNNTNFTEKSTNDDFGGIDFDDI